MRKSLKKYNGKRIEFTAKVGRKGKKSGWRGREEITLLLQNIKSNSGEFIADHIWVNWTKTLRCAGIKEGDQINFKGTVESYLKGYFGRRDDIYIEPQWDFKIARLAQVAIVQPNNH